MSSVRASSSTSVNRWIIAIAAFCMQLVLGAVYAWSVFLKPVASLYYHIPAKQLTSAQLQPANLTFSIALLGLGITAGFGGYFNNRFGPRVVATVGGVCYGLGLVLAGLAPNLFILYLTYGILGGIGLGLAYIVPLAMLIKWFPDRRGFITGLAVAGFGAGAAVTSPLAANLLIPSLGVQQTFIYLGIIFTVPRQKDMHLPVGHLRCNNKQPV